jgi:hypothetical protein
MAALDVDGNEEWRRHQCRTRAVRSELCPNALVQFGLRDLLLKINSAATAR